MVAKFGISACINMSFIGSVDLIPTIFNARVLGIGNVFAGIITIMSPLVAVINYPGPLIINVITSSVAAIAASRLVVNLPKFI
jgi:hypothetical protein